MIKMFRDIRRPRDSPRLKVHDRILTNNRLYFPLNVVSRIERISSFRLKTGKERDPFTLFEHVQVRVSSRKKKKRNKKKEKQIGQTE